MRNLIQTRKKKYDEVVFHCGFFAIGICLLDKLYTIFFIPHTKTQVLSLEWPESSTIDRIDAISATFGAFCTLRRSLLAHVRESSCSSTTKAFVRPPCRGSSSYLSLDSVEDSDDRLYLADFLTSS